MNRRKFTPQASAVLAGRGYPNLALDHPGHGIGAPLAAASSAKPQDTPWHWARRCRHWRH